MRAKAPVAAGLVGLAALLWLDGWLGSAPGSRSVEPSGKPPPEMARALDGAVRDLAARADAFAAAPDVVRALSGGGIAVVALPSLGEGSLSRTSRSFQERRALDNSVFSTQPRLRVSAG